MDEKEKIRSLMADLVSLDESFIRDGESLHFIELLKGESGSEVQIYGNTAGLIHIARKVIEVASKGSNGAHHHFDESGLVDRCDIPVVVTFKDAEW